MKTHRKIDIAVKVIVTAVIASLSIAIFIGSIKKTSAPGGGSGKPGANTKSAAAANTVTVSVYTAVPSSIESTVKINGDISSQSEINMYPDTSGKITRILKHAGDKVARGEIIAYIDPSKPGSAYVASPVISTVSGTIIKIPVQEGSTASTGTAVASVGSLNDLQITVNAAEKYSTFLKPGLRAYVTLTSIPDTVFLAYAAKISPVVDSSKRTIETTLHFSSKDSRIKPGMFASVRLVIQEAKNTVVIPKSALSSYNTEKVVYIVGNGNKAVRKTVKTGLSNDTHVQITDGVSFGNNVITAGSVTNGTLVRAAGSAAAGRPSAGDASKQNAAAGTPKQNDQSGASK